MSVKIAIDSASDITKDEAQQKNLIFLPMEIQWGKEHYLDGVDLTAQEFFQKLIESDILPKTSQITPYRFEEVITEVLEQGDELLIITISSKLSGTYFSAVQAASDYPGRVFVVDSKNACIGERLLIEHAIRLREQGLGAAEIADTLETSKENICLLALLGTLEYLKKGGRISPLVAFAGEKLGIKPVISIVDGEVKLLGKARGSKVGNNLLMKMVQEADGIDFSMPYATAYSGLDDFMLKKYIADSEVLWNGQTEEIPMFPIGSTIGTHIGPGAIAVAFFKNKMS